MNSGKSGEKVEATTEKAVEPTSTVTEPTTQPSPSQPSEAPSQPTEAPLISSQAAETSPSSESSSVVDSSVADTSSVSDSPPTEAPIVVLAAGIIPVVQSGKVDNTETTQGTEAITEINNPSTTGKNAASLTHASLPFALLIVAFQFFLNK